MRHFSMLSLVEVALALAIVAGMRLTAPTETTSGRLLAVYPDRQVFILEEHNGKGARTFELDKMGQVFINDKPASLGELLPGEHVVVIYDMRVDLSVAQEVRCERF